MLHHIQKTILDSLATAESLRYGEIKPQELDGNVFVYHLKSLIRDGYVTKQDDGAYILTSKGRETIVRRREPIETSAHSVFFIVVKRDDQYLLRRRLVMPLIGHVGFVHGEPHVELETALSARKRLYDKTGVDCQLQVQGAALITQYKNGELQSFTHAIILYGITDQEITISSDSTGENFWSASVNESSYLPSCSDIIDMIESDMTWLEKTYYL